MPGEVFFVPIFGRILFYDPLHRLSALITRTAATKLGRFSGPTDDFPPRLRDLAKWMSAPVNDIYPALDSALNPLYLGIIPTRGCNIGCRYCNFAASKNASPTMSVELGCQAVDAYLTLIKQAGHVEGRIHFFGGEPFYARFLVRTVLEYAAKRARARGLTIRFEVTTNGVYDVELCHWIGQNFDVVVLSLDGLPTDQDHQRPTLAGHGTFEIVARSARIFSEGRAEFIIRACVSADSVAHMPAFARWLGVELKPSMVCFETLSLSPLAAQANLTPPDPYRFAQSFDRTAEILAEYGIRIVTSSVDLSAPRVSICPLSKDALIVSPDGSVDACYLLETEWQARGLDMRLGQMRQGEFEIDRQALRRVRGMHVQNRPLCANCLCRFHCAGGCYVQHETSRPAGQFDDWCVQTRLITITRLLRGLGQPDLAQAFLATPAAWQAAVWQQSDRSVNSGQPALTTLEESNSL